MDVVDTMALPLSSIVGIRVVELTLEDEAELRSMSIGAGGA